MNMDQYCEIDFEIMRGFDYYTGMVFEVFDKNKKYRAIAGGGRYDNLVADLGGDRCPGVGYGMGDVVLQVFMKENKKIPKLQRNVDYFIAIIGKVQKQALKISSKLRKKYNVVFDVSSKGLSKQLDYANSIGAKKVIIVGERDIKKGFVIEKDLKTGKQRKLKLSLF